MATLIFVLLANAILRLVELLSLCDLFLCNLGDPISAAGQSSDLEANMNRALGWVFGWFGVAFFLLGFSLFLCLSE